MKDGEVVEEGAAKAVFDNPRHPYTKMLLQAAPRLPDSRFQEPRFQEPRLRNHAGRSRAETESGRFSPSLLPLRPPPWTYSTAGSAVVGSRGP
ncbi:MULTISPECIES: hypothetical protein [Frankia]|nr:MULTISPECIES: hypothetical protein [Frankia]